jgi:hypothetical protein
MNPFQKAVRDIQKIVGPQNVRIFKGQGGSVKDDAEDGDEDSPLTIRVHGHGDFSGNSLDAALKKAKDALSKAKTS